MSDEYLFSKEGSESSDKKVNCNNVQLLFCDLLHYARGELLLILMISVSTIIDKEEERRLQRQLIVTATKK